MKKQIKKILSRNNKNFENDFEATDFGDYLEAGDVKTIDFSLRKQDKLITLRVSNDLLQMLKKAADKHHTKYQKLMRLILEKNIGSYV